MLRAVPSILARRRLEHISLHVGPRSFHKAGKPPFCLQGQALQPRSLASAAAAPMSATHESRYVDANGHRFYVVKAGSDSAKQPVLCMPGALGTAVTDFPQQLEGLSEQHQVISFDPRGYGNSRPPVRDWPADFYHRDARDAHAIMESLGFSEYNVVGWSDGANAAVILAAMQPQAVRRLVIFGGNAWVDQDDIDSYEATREVKKNWSKRMLATHLPVYGDDLQPMWDGFCDAMKGLLSRGGDICQKEALRIQCMTFVLAGAKDPMVPMCHPEWFSKNIRSARLHVFPEGKHNIHIKYAQEFNQLVMDFFAE